MWNGLGSVPGMGPDFKRMGMSLTVRRPLVCFVVAGVCAGLGGCHPKPKAPPPAPVVVTPVKPPVVLPARQPGLWQTTITEDGSEDTPQGLQICVDAQTDQHLGVLGNDLSGDTCKRTVSKTGDGWGLLAECDMGSGGTNEFSGSITGDYSRDYSMKVRSQTTGAALPTMNRVTNYTVVSRWTGACAKDQAPGDVIVNDGFKINLFDMAGRAVSRPVQDASASDAPAGDGD